MTPTFNQFFELRTTSESDDLLVEVMDDNKLTKDTLVGTALVPLRILQLNGSAQFVAWHPLIGRDRNAQLVAAGEVKLLLVWLSDPDRQQAASVAGSAVCSTASIAPTFCSSASASTTAIDHRSPRRAAHTGTFKPPPLLTPASRAPKPGMLSAIGSMLGKLEEVVTGEKDAVILDEADSTEAHPPPHTHVHVHACVCERESAHPHQQI